MKNTVLRVFLVAAVSVAGCSGGVVPSEGISVPVLEAFPEPKVTERCSGEFPSPSLLANKLQPCNSFSAKSERDKNITTTIEFEARTGPEASFYHCLISSNDSVEPRILTFYPQSQCAWIRCPVDKSAGDIVSWEIWRFNGNDWSEGCGSTN